MAEEKGGGGGKEMEICGFARTMSDYCAILASESLHAPLSTRKLTTKDKDTEKYINTQKCTEIYKTTT